jgi:uncharacterized protein YqeY
MSRPNRSDIAPRPGGISDLRAAGAQRTVSQNGVPERAPPGQGRTPSNAGDALGGGREAQRPGELACGAARQAPSVTAMPGPPDPALPLHIRLRRALPSALKARDQATVAALRSVLAAIDNAQAVEAPPAPRSDSVVAGAVTGLGAGEAPRRQLSEDDVAAVVRAEVADRRAAASDYERAGQLDSATRLTAEADVLTAYLADARR